MTIFTFVKAQNTATTIWTETFGLQDTVLKIPTAIDPDGNVLVAGSFIDSVTGPNIVLKKFNRAGSPIWTVDYEGTGYHRDQATAIAIDNNYNIFVGGFTYTNSTNNYDYLVLKYDSAGTLLWTYTYNGTGSAADLVSALVINSGDVYLTGASVGSSTLFDYTTIKLNSSGTLVWNNRYNYLGNDLPFDIDISGTKVFVNGGSQNSIADWDYAQLIYTMSGTPFDTLRTTGTGIGFDHATQAVTDVQGYIYITGAYATVSNGLDYKTIKLDQQGNIKWISTFDGPSHLDDIANSVGVDYYGNVYVTGQSRKSSSHDDYCTIKYDSTGTEQWVRFYNYTLDDRANRLIVGDDNNIYVTGESSNGSNKDFATLAYNPDGDTLWEIRFNGAYNSDDMATNIQKDGDFVYVSGQKKINATTYQYVTIAYGEATYENIPDAFNEPVGSTWFYPDNGQLANDTGGVLGSMDYYSQNQGPAMYLYDSHVSYVFSKIDSDTATTDTLHRVDMNFMTDSIHHVKEEFYPVDKASSHYLNFYLPHCASGVVDVHGYKTLFVDDLYKGIDAYFSSNQAGAKHYFVINRGDISDIVMKFAGDDSISHSLGTYSIHTSIGTLKYDSLVAYEVDASGAIIPNTMQPLDIYADTANGYWHFVPFSYNTSNTLVIMAKKNYTALGGTGNDNLKWSTYLGNSSNDQSGDLASDNDGNFYIAGYSSADFFPNANGQLFYAASTDAFLEKYNAEDGTWGWGTYFGGSSIEVGSSVGVDLQSPNVYLLGQTQSNNIPAGPVIPQYYSYSGSSDIFVAKFSALNGTFDWSTYFGGSGAENIATCATSNDIVYFGGGTWSNNIQIISNGYTQSNANGGNGDGFIGAFKSDGTPFWLSYFGGDGADNVGDIAFDENNHIFITGLTTSANTVSISSPYSGGQTGLFPIGYDNTFTTTPYINGSLNGGLNLLRDAYITEFGSDRKLIWSTFVGGQFQENSYGYGRIETKFSNGISKVFIAGTTASDNFPLNPINTSTGYNQPYLSNITGLNIFLTRFIDRALDWSTLIGGSGDEYLGDIIYTDNFDIYVTGKTATTVGSLNSCNPLTNGNFPLCNSNTNYYFDDTFNSGLYDQYLTGFNDNTELIWSTYFGGEADEDASTLTYIPDLGNGCKLILSGTTNSTSTYPLWQLLPNGYWQPSNAGLKDCSISRFDLDGSCFPVTSVKNVEKQDGFNIFPNPNNGKISIKNNSEFSYKFLKVFSVEGKMLLKIENLSFNSNQTMEIDMKQQLNSGLYFIELGNSTTSNTLKMVVNK